MVAVVVSVVAAVVVVFVVAKASTWVHKDRGLMDSCFGTVCPLVWDILFFDLYVQVVSVQTQMMYVRIMSAPQTS